jgi:hypothetical protein
MRRNYEHAIQRGRESAERRADGAGWRFLGAVGTAVAVLVGAGAAIKERVDAAADEVYVEAQVRNACRITTTDSDRMLCEDEVRREVFGRGE